ncbi:hypothetical protein [Actinomyces mediterranea]|nr:hypothetical protein [Actinomyces mediterranea]
MAKTDLAVRAVFHHARESIEAHLTIVFTALPSPEPDAHSILNHLPGY